MGTRAWNAEGDVSRFNAIPLAAARKAILRYKGIIATLAKLTLNGVTYDIQKQAKEGLVTIAEGFDSMTFFLPENREPITAEQGQNLNIKTYFEMMGSTDYAEIPAWDYFVGHLGTFVDGLEDPTVQFPYEINTSGGSYILESGSMSINDMGTFKEMAKRIGDTISNNNNQPLSAWLLDDGTVTFQLHIRLSDQSLIINMNVGRK